MSRSSPGRDAARLWWVGALAAMVLLITPRPAAAQSPTASAPSSATPSSATPSAATPSSATPSAADSTLRLRALLQEAASANPSLQAARLKAEARAAESAQARALPDPVAGVTVLPYPIVTARGPQRSQWRVRQSLPVPGTRALRGEVADLEADAARADAEALEQDLALQIRRAFYTLYRVQEEERLVRRFQSDLGTFEEAALAQYEVGREGQPAVLKAQIERQRLEMRLESLAAERRSARHTLARLTGRSALRGRLAADSVAAPDAPARERDGARDAAAAVDRRPEAQAIRAQIDRSERRIALAERDRWPNVTLGLQYVDVQKSDLAPTMTGRDALAVSVGVQVPLWRGKQQAQIDEARVEQQRAEAQLDAFTLEVRTRLADLRQQIDRQRRQLRLLDETLLPKAETALEATLSGYRTGQSDFLDLLDAQRTRFQLQVTRATLHARLLKTRAELKRTIGQ